PEARNSLLACALRSRRNTRDRSREAQFCVAGHHGRSSDAEIMGGDRCRALPTGSALTGSRPRLAQERDRPLGPGGARQQYPGADAVARLLESQSVFAGAVVLLARDDKGAISR